MLANPVKENTVYITELASGTELRNNAESVPVKLGRKLQKAVDYFREDRSRLNQSNYNVGRLIDCDEKTVRNAKRIVLQDD